MSRITPTPYLATALLAAVLESTAAPATGKKRHAADRKVSDVLLVINGAPFMFKGPLSPDGGVYPHDGEDPVVSEARARLEAEFGPMDKAPLPAPFAELLEAALDLRAATVDFEDDSDLDAAKTRFDEAVGAVAEAGYRVKLAPCGALAGRVTDDSGFVFEDLPADEVRPGDCIDLEGLPGVEEEAFPLAAFEWLEVLSVERETEGCVRLDFGGCPSLGLAPDTFVKVRRARDAADRLHAAGYGFPFRMGQGPTTWTVETADARKTLPGSYASQAAAEVAALADLYQPLTIGEPRGHVR